MLAGIAANLNHTLSLAQRQRLRRWLHPAWLGTIRRTVPLSDCYGFDRGTPVDRYYIERFLEKYRTDISRHVLEVKDSTYTNRYGTGVEQRDVLDIDGTNPLLRSSLISRLPTKFPQTNLIASC